MRVQYARAWKMDLSDYPVHHDPENVFGSHFDVVLDKDMASQRPGYKEGGLMVQPACIVLDSDGKIERGKLLKESLHGCYTSRRASE